MTKPDLLSAGSIKSRELWLDVMEGRRHQLAHGYYCTRQPDDADRSQKITADQARKVEAEFFSQTAPWSTTADQSRLGTSNLVGTLSKLLVEIIDHRYDLSVALLAVTYTSILVCRSSCPRPSPNSRSATAGYPRCPLSSKWIRSRTCRTWSLP